MAAHAHSAYAHFHLIGQQVELEERRKYSRVQEKLKSTQRWFLMFLIGFFTALIAFTIDTCTFAILECYRVYIAGDGGSVVVFAACCRVLVLAIRWWASVTNHTRPRLYPFCVMRIDYCLHSDATLCPNLGIQMLSKMKFAYVGASIRQYAELIPP